jgi:hypothetical protein
MGTKYSKLHHFIFSVVDDVTLCNRKNKLGTHFICGFVE